MCMCVCVTIFSLWYKRVCVCVCVCVCILNIAWVNTSGFSFQYEEPINHGVYKKAATTW